MKDFIMDIIKIATSGIFGILGILLGYFLSRNSTQKAVDMSFEKLNIIIDKQEFIRAANKFRNSFIKEIVELEKMGNNPPKESVYKVLFAARDRHKNAMIDFRYFLKGADLDKFNQAWIDFSGDDYENQNFKKSYQQYDVNENIENISEFALKKLAMKNIDKLLDFSRLENHKTI